MRRILIITILMSILFLNEMYAKASKKSRIQVAIILDTSGSMDGLIDQTKAQLWKIVNELALARYHGQQPDLEIALYEYGNDGLPAKEGYLRMISQLTRDLDKISEELFALRTNGGSEYCGQVIEAATSGLAWSRSSEDLKMIFIAGNEAFTQGSVSYEKACKAAITKGIIVNTIFCGNYQEGVNTKWKHGADISDGKYMNIDHNQKVAYVATPFDDQITALNDSLNRTYIAYGVEGKEKRARQQAQDSNAQGLSKANLASRAVAKSSANYKNEQWDLVDAAEEDEKVLAEIAPEALPKEMQSMDDKERKTYISSKKKDRSRIQSKILDLDKKRRKYIAEKQKENTKKNTIDAVMINAVRDLATENNYKFVE